MMNLIRPFVQAIFSDWRMNAGIAVSIPLNVSIGKVVNQWLTVIIPAMTIVYLVIKISNVRRGAKMDKPFEH